MDTHLITTPKPERSSTSPAREVAAIIARLMLHFPGVQVSDAARHAMAADWLEDLAEFGPAIVGEACKQWRQKPGARRPTSGDIRAICVELRNDEREARLAREAKNAEQAAGKWDTWLYELWGPESTGRGERQRAIAAQDARWRRAEGIRLQSGPILSLDQLAQQKGYASYEAACQAGVKVIPALGLRRMPRDAGPRPSTAGWLGVEVEARPEYMPSPEALARARVQLGLEEEPAQIDLHEAAE